MSDKDNIKVFETAEALNEGTAQFILEKAQAAIRARGKFTIALSGGNTPEKLFELLAKSPYDASMPWEKIFIFWGDERAVPLKDDRNNAQKAKTLLLDKVNIPTANIYRIPSDLKPQRAAEIYEDTIRYFFKGGAPLFDLVLLGVGENGHTASLFPYTTALHDVADIVVCLYVEEQKMYRITMTAALINMAHNVLFLVSGSGKAEILKTVIEGAYDPDQYPAQMINPHSGGLYWYLDKDAAALLTL